MRRRPGPACAAALLVTVLGSLAACGIDAEPEPSPVPSDQVPADVDGSPDRAPRRGDDGAGGAP